jgi:hypothetical protein
VSGKWDKTKYIGPFGFAQDGLFAAMSAVQDDSGKEESRWAWNRGW